MIIKRNYLVDSENFINYSTLIVEFLIKNAPLSTFLYEAGHFLVFYSRFGRIYRSKLIIFTIPGAND